MDVYGLIGNPVGHSLSPPMQEAGFDACGIDARYVTFEPPRSRAGEAIAGAQVLGIRGLNVTIPFKEAVLEHVEPDELAREVGAVNTVDLATDPPRGYNTDVDGAIRAFRHHDVAVDGTDAVVLGAGGAGRAVAYGLCEAGSTVAIANRTTERAVNLADELPAATGHGLDELGSLLADADLLVNATSVGMESDERIVPPAALHADLVVMDAVYRPLRTRLLRDAAAAEATTIDGAWMLLFQGVAAFERWTGVDAPVAAMNDALRLALDSP